MMDHSTYKAQHELFVSGSLGTSTAEVVQVALVIPIAVFLHRSVHVAARSAGIPLYPDAVPDSSQVHVNAAQLSIARTVLLLVIEFVFLVLPTLLVCTSQEWRSHLYIFMVLAGLLCQGYARAKATPRASGAWVDILENKHVHCISLYRAYMMVLTCVCILAVDFRVFPRAFAKTETFGQSVMDVGVGCFVFASALVSKQAQASVAEKGGPAGASTSSRAPSYGKVIGRTLLKVSPLLIMGFVRLIGTKSTDYQEHVSEYGVHWNFFFTLAGISLIVSILNPRADRAIATGVFVAILYQVALRYGLEDYIMEAPRANLISMNKEGLFSCFGYVAIYLCGLQLGTLLLPRGRGAAQKLKAAFVSMAVTDGASWALMLLSETFIAETSRRMANLTYVLFTVSYNILSLMLLLGLDLVVEPAPQLILFSINRNSLILFLVANLMTGAVNLSMHTIYASDSTAYLVLSAYMFAFCAAAVALHKLNLTLRFW